MPDSIDALLIAGFTLDVRVMPNGQEVDLIQVVLEFDPNHLKFIEAELDGGSLMRTELIDGELRNGRVVFAAQETRSPPSTTFTLGSVTFEVLAVQANSSITFTASGEQRTYASFDGQEVTRDSSGATVNIGMFTFP